ncbi:MAG: hypothetical protein KF892_24960 [Rhizobacter sp.]|nr:hypothetical protein [Rhizobacter sp.]
MLHLLEGPVEDADFAQRLKCVMILCRLPRSFDRPHHLLKEQTLARCRQRLALDLGKLRFVTSIEVVPRKTASIATGLSRVEAPTLMTGVSRVPSSMTFGPSDRKK